MADVDFKPNPKGFVELLNSNPLQFELRESANRICDAAEAMSFRNSEYDADVQSGKNRAHARAKTASRGAYWSAFKRHSLTNAIDAGRL